MRTVQTFAAICSVFGDIRAVVTDALYNADSATLRRMIEAHEDAAKHILLIAHNPGVQYLVMDYLSEGAASMEVMAKVSSGYPTATATAFEVDVAGRPLFEGLYRPKDLGVS
jgi:phosphohistidine phosphatase